MITCPEKAQYIQEDHATCGAECPSGFFSFNSTLNAPQCKTSCDFPLTKVTNATFNNYFQCEVTCQAATKVSGLFLTADQLCTNSCVYQNLTNTAQAFCEDNGSVPSANCLFQTPIQGTTNFVCSVACDASLFVSGTICLAVCPQNTFVQIAGGVRSCVNTCASFYIINLTLGKPQC